MSWNLLYVLDAFSISLFAISYYLNCYRRGYRIDIWHSQLFLICVLPNMIMLPFAKSGPAQYFPDYVARLLRHISGRFCVAPSCWPRNAKAGDQTAGYCPPMLDDADVVSKPAGVPSIALPVIANHHSSHIFWSRWVRIRPQAIHICKSCTSPGCSRCFQLFNYYRLPLPRTLCR